MPAAGLPRTPTFILQALLDKKVKDAAIAMFWDPGAVKLAFEVGEGAELDIRLGGKLGPQSGPPIDARAKVLKLEKDVFIQFGGPRKGTNPIGDVAALQIDGVTVIVNSKRSQCHSLDCFTKLGIDPSTKKIVVVKSMQHFHAAYAPIASEVVYVAAPARWCRTGRCCPTPRPTRRSGRSSPTRTHDVKRLVSRRVAHRRAASALAQIAERRANPRPCPAPSRPRAPGVSAPGPVISSSSPACRASIRRPTSWSRATEARIRQAFLNIKLIAQSEGASLQDRVRLTVYVSDLARIAPLVDKVQAELWGGRPIRRAPCSRPSACSTTTSSRSTASSTRAAK